MSKIVNISNIILISLNFILDNLSFVVKELNIFEE